MNAAESSIQHGSRIGRFTVLAELGAGGMGVVYVAHDPQLDRQVALKVMRGAGDNEYEDRMRMLREGQAMARVTHPNVITVFEANAEGGIVFLAQELLDGGTLGAWLKEPHTQDEIVEKFVAAGRGLAAAHAAGLVHRDFKPDNVLLGKDGRVRVSDFGLARFHAYAAAGGDAAIADLAGPTNRGGGPPQNDIDVTRSPMSPLTKTGAVMGTPMFMAPEQHEGKRADERSDQFAFCVALYHALYGDWPFAGKTAIALADNVINGVMQPPPPNKKVPARLRNLLLRGLSIDPAARFPSMDALLAELTARPKRSPIPLVLGALVIVAGVGAGVFMLLQGSGDAPPKVVEQPLPKPVDLPVDDGTALVEALDSGKLAIVTRQYERDAKITQDAARTAIAEAGIAYTLALSGDLPGAEAKLKEVDAKKGTDARAAAFADMAWAAFRSAAGEPTQAVDHAQRCATAFEGNEPQRAAVCYQMRGESSADLGNFIDARTAFESGQRLAKQVKSIELDAMLSLSLAQLELDEKQEDASLDAVTKLQTDAHRRRAASCEAAAAVLASRMWLVKGEQKRALQVFDELELEESALQVYRLRMLARIAIGEVYGFLGEADAHGVMGLDRIADAHDEAKRRGFWGLVLEAKLARVRVKLTNGAEDAEQERKDLIAEANAKGYKRIAQLAQRFDVSIDRSPTTPSP